MKYKFNKNSFTDKDLINSYWAGFIAADGNIKQPKYGQKILTITLAEKDKEHLEKFKNFLKSNKPIYTFKNGACSFEISSNDICNDLISNFNLKEKKTFDLLPPNLNKNYALAYIIGYIDGDGCIYINEKDNQIDLSITGTESILRYIENNFNKLTQDTSERTIYDKNQNQIYSIRWGKKRCRIIIKELKAIVEQLPVLNRKWKKAFDNVENYIPFQKSKDRCKEVKKLKEQGKSNKEIMKLVGLNSKTSIYNCLEKI